MIAVFGNKAKEGVGWSMIVLVSDVGWVASKGEGYLRQLLSNCFLCPTFKEISAKFSESECYSSCDDLVTRYRM